MYCRSKKIFRKILNVQQLQLGSQNKITDKGYMQGNNPEICLRKRLRIGERMMDL